MEVMASFYGCEENVEELKNLLVQSLYALETAKKQAEEDKRRNEETESQLLNLLQVALQERDEAREQLQKLLSLGSAPDVSPVLPTLPPESPMYHSISDAISFGSGTSPVDSFFNMAPSPDLSGLDNFGDSSILGAPVSSHAVPQDCIGDFSDSSTMGLPVPVSSCAIPQECYGNFSDSSMMGFPLQLSSNVTPEYKCIGSFVGGTDTSSHVMDSLVRGKTLPKKGNLLKTVMEAGPLLGTLLVSGSLPQWRNPPPPLQSYQMSPFSVKGYDTQSVNFKSIANANQLSYGSCLPTGSCINRGVSLSSASISPLHRNHSNKFKTQFVI